MFDSLLTGSPASSKTLAGLCHRLALSLDAGIDIRRAWRSEAGRVTGRGASACRDVEAALDVGEPLDDALRAGGAYFPPLLLEMTRVGERTGTTPAVLQRMATHYQRRVDRARGFRRAIAWPLIQLTIALAVVGLLIAIGGVLDDGRGKPVDLLGVGLVGFGGLMVYVCLLCSVVLVIGLGWAALRRRPELSARVREAAMRVPFVGSALKEVALARVAWALNLTMNVELDLRRLAPIVLDASDNERFTRHTDDVVAAVERGDPLSAAFERTGVFPERFLDTLRIGEETGMISETMERLSRQYDDEAEHAIQQLTGVAAVLVWLAVAALIIGLIFRLFSFYNGILNGALSGL